MAALTSGHDDDYPRARRRPHNYRRRGSPRGALSSSTWVSGSLVTLSPLALGAGLLVLASSKFVGASTTWTLPLQSEPSGESPSPPEITTATGNPVTWTAARVSSSSQRPY